MPDGDRRVVKWNEAQAAPSSFSTSYSTSLAITMTACPLDHSPEARREASHSQRPMRGLSKSAFGTRISPDSVAT
jgi:hypothetical protein